SAICSGSSPPPTAPPPIRCCTRWGSPPPPAPPRAPAVAPVARRPRAPVPPGGPGARGRICRPMRTDTPEIAGDLRTLAEGDAAAVAAAAERLAAHGIGLLPEIEEHLASGDLPIAVLERYEAVLKAVLRRALAAGPVSGETARAIASF